MDYILSSFFGSKARAKAGPAQGEKQEATYSPAVYTRAGAFCSWRALGRSCQTRVAVPGHQRTFNDWVTDERPQSSLIMEVHSCLISKLQHPAPRDSNGTLEFSSAAAHAQCALRRLPASACHLLKSLHLDSSLACFRPQQPLSACRELRGEEGCLGLECLWHAPPAAAAQQKFTPPSMAALRYIHLADRERVASCLTCCATLHRTSDFSGCIPIYGVCKQIRTTALPNTTPGCLHDIPELTRTGHFDVHTATLRCRAGRLHLCISAGLDRSRPPRHTCLHPHLSLAQGIEAAQKMG